MLTGHVPFAAATFMETLEQIVTQDPVPPGQLNAKVPRDLDTICLKCLRKEPEQRYQSAVELAADLQHFLDGEAIRARRETLIEQITRAVVRRRQDFPHYANWGRMLLVLAPFPALIHLVLVLGFQHADYFPLLAITVSLATGFITQVIISLGAREGLRCVPASLRRHANITWGGYFLAYPLLIFAVWRYWPADQPDFVLIMYPLSIITVAVAQFAFAAEMGAFFISGAVTFVAGLLTTMFPVWAPFIAGLLITFNVGGFGLLHTYWARQVRRAAEADHD
jgi:hypothetical protein